MKFAVRTEATTTFQETPRTKRKGRDPCVNNSKRLAKGKVKIKNKLNEQQTVRWHGKRQVCCMCNREKRREHITQTMERQ